MKKVLFTLVALVTFSFAAKAQPGNNIEEQAKRKAEIAARECTGLNGFPDNIYSVATLNLYCDNFFHANPNWGGFSVNVYRKFVCPPGFNCPDVVIDDELIATVLVDCQGQVYDVQCMQP